MAYIVMAYVGMADGVPKQGPPFTTVMAYIVMAYIIIAEAAPGPFSGCNAQIPQILFAEGAHVRMFIDTKNAARVVPRHV